MIELWTTIRAAICRVARAGSVANPRRGWSDFSGSRDLDSPSSSSCTFLGLAYRALRHRSRGGVLGHRANRGLRIVNLGARDPLDSRSADCTAATHHEPQCNEKSTPGWRTTRQKCEPASRGTGKVSDSGVYRLRKNYIRNRVKYLIRISRPIRHIILSQERNRRACRRAHFC